MSNTDIPERTRPDAAAQSDIPGMNQRQLGRYSLLRELRRNRDSVTLLALDPVMHREVVLKVVRLPPPHDGVRGGDAETHALEQAFVRQAQAAGRLHHPHIVTVFEAARVHDLAFLAIERINGRPLHELLASGWRPDLVHCASLVARIADAIEYAHNQSIAHGHLGPQHVLLQPNGTPRIEGFGGWIDGGAAGDDALARTEKLLPYFQNELTEEMRAHDVRSVVILLHMILTGKPPQMHSAHDEGTPSRPISVLALRPDTPPALAQLIDETLDSTSQTHRTAADVRDVLTAYIWNARKSHVAPATIGIPLAAPPETAPDLPQADLTVIARPRASRKTIAPQGPATITRTITGTSQRMTAPPRTFPTQMNEDIEPEALDAADFSAQAPTQISFKDWIKQNRFVVMGAAALIAIGIGVGMLLGRSSPIVPQRAEATATAAAPAQSTQGVVSLDIQPWGEVLVDGKLTGVTPPLSEIKLSTGVHTIEIRHGDKAAISAQVDVSAHRAQIIRHRFE